ncbi:NAD(P)H-dependent flavin oxidoreductase [Rhizosphaericola mali]|uniref:Nitronate monooxygenase n=1 Tax=Rhizosphaericola mali TaxID=2545455 RepID=A0A5P2FXK7_9BACT|nr:nitronate monooxygenase family protein [Rhizosphaericola mali]QES87935.1 nitronate monooxygenase [Rhizosphaericola mali]
MNINELKERVSLPVIVSPMFLVSGTKIVIESCKNGIVGTFPALNGRTSEDFENMLKEIISALEEFEKSSGIKPAPFGVNLIVNKTNPRLLPDLQLCIKYKVPIIITSLGAVKDIVDAVHDYGGIVLHDIVKKRHAEKAIEAGVDGIICVAAGAGGHAGTANPFALVEEIRDFYKGFLVLAGAINNGKDIVATTSIGADFAYMGTRFIATEESLASSDYKELLETAIIDDIIYTDAVSGVNANFLLPSIEKSGFDLTHKKEEDFSQLSGAHAKAWKDVWSAGHGVAGIHEILPVEKLVNNLKSQYKETLLKNSETLKSLKY